MIIHCNDKQRTSIYHNRKYILINDTNCSYKLGPFHKLLLVCIWCAVYMMGGIVFAINLDKIGLLLYTIGSYMAVSFMTIKILTCRYIHRKLKSIQRNEKLSINGATITRVNPKYGVFEYVEDDVKDIEQKKYINEGNIFTKRTKNLEVGQRLIILYGLDHVFEKTYVMIPENEMLSLIPASSPDVDLNKLESYNDELDTYKNNVINTVANPSCTKIRKDEYYISEEEKKKIITSNYLEIELKQIKKIFLICGIMIGLGTNTFVGIITVVNTLPIIFTVLLFIIANVAVALFLKYFYGICRKKRTTYPVSDQVQEVVFKERFSYERGRYQMRVYEWNKDNEIECNAYPMYLYGVANEGDILYKMKIDERYYFYVK